jgi:hypothetical protein
MEGLSLAEITCVEELIGMMSKKRLIAENILLILLNLITNPEVAPTYRRNSLKLFSFLLKDKPQFLEENIEVLLKVAFGPIGQVIIWNLFHREIQ